MPMKALTVTQVNEYLKDIFSSDPLLSGLCISGEISNFKRHSSGHLYFTLKDQDSVISAVMFRSDAARLRFMPNSGMKVFVTGRVSIYPKSGQYQVYVSAMQPDGIGALYMAFEQLKEKLYGRGLFDPQHKKPLPPYPGTVALVTSPTGAAVRDMIRIIKSRYPICDIIVCPVKVQGEGAAEEIADMIDYVSRHSLADVIITGRGGGSLEDLWAFNEEVVAEAIFRSDIPIISAVGHEPDITISDYVADVRASTPSNAAELVVPDQAQLRAGLKNAGRLIEKYQHDSISALRKRVADAAGRPVMRGPKEYLSERRMDLSVLEDRLESAQRLALERRRREYLRLAAGLDALSPLGVLSRGYSMATSGDGRIIKSVGQLSPGDSVVLRLADGRAECTADRLLPDRKEKKNG